MRCALLVTAALLSAGFAPSRAQAQATMQQALAAAQRNSSGLTLLYGRTEMKAGSTVFGFYFLTRTGRILETEINPSGQVVVNVTVDEITGDDAPNKGKVDPNVVTALQNRVLAKLPGFQYIELALGKNGGSASSFQLNLVNGQLQVQVGGTGNDGSSWQSTLDMSTGQILN